MDTELRGGIPAHPVAGGRSAGEVYAPAGPTPQVSAHPPRGRPHSFTCLLQTAQGGGTAIIQQFNFFWVLDAMEVRTY